MVTGQPALFGITGADATSRQDLLAALLRGASARAIGVSALIEADADFDIDLPGKDSFEHRRAGAREVVMASSRRWAKMHERAAPWPKPAPEADRAATDLRLRQALAAMGPADLVLVEGFEAAGHPRLRIDEGLAVWEPPDTTDGKTRFGLDDIEGILGMILDSQGIDPNGGVAIGRGPAGS